MKETTAACLSVSIGARWGNGFSIISFRERLTFRIASEYKELLKSFKKGKIHRPLTLALPLGKHALSSLNNS